MKGKALRRALASADAVRVGADLPLITDTTEVITPQIAQTMLSRNQRNRPINWKAVERYADLMAAGQWQFHGQGILLDGADNILTGQTRLWAIVYSGTTVPMRISRGNPPASAHAIDRGRAQSSRDLATRETGRTHSPTEASIARAIRVLQGDLRPSVDMLADTISQHASVMQALLTCTAGTKKTKAVIMIAGAMVFAANGDTVAITNLAVHINVAAQRLEASLAPQTAAQCWGKGAAFGLAMEAARKLVWERM